MKENSKSLRYERLYKQLSDVLGKTDDINAQMATISAVLYHKLTYFFWCGFYRVEPENLIVVTYQGPLACQLLPKNTGVCWAAVTKTKPLLSLMFMPFPDTLPVTQGLNQKLWCCFTTDWEIPWQYWMLTARKSIHLMKLMRIILKKS